MSGSAQVKWLVYIPPWATLLGTPVQPKSVQFSNSAIHHSFYVYHAILVIHLRFYYIHERVETYWSLHYEMNLMFWHPYLKWMRETVLHVVSKRHGPAHTVYEPEWLEKGAFWLYFNNSEKVLCSQAMIKYFTVLWLNSLNKVGVINNS